MTWSPSKEIINNSNIGKMMQKHSFTNYDDFWKWTVENKTTFWEDTVSNLNIVQFKKYNQILNTDAGVENAKWLYGAKLNIVDSCFQNDDDATAIIFQKTNKEIQKISQKELLEFVNKIANSFQSFNVNIGDTIAIDLPMTIEAVAIYLAAIKAGIKVATIVDSFSAKEIAVRFNITKPKLVFTQDVIKRGAKTIPLYTKVLEANPEKVVVISIDNIKPSIRKKDVFWKDFLSNNSEFESIKQSPEEVATILFSSGTTGEPKAIPWNHTTPIKSASDGYYHHNIQQNDVVCWPTNLGWMMGPWLVFAALINKATIALYYDSPLETGFGKYVQDAKVTMLGIVPSIVKQWKSNKNMESFNWNAIKCFSSTGEVSNATEMKYLIELANNKPVIEYCGGTEIGGGYITSTVVQKNIASNFSTKALGGDFVMLDENEEESTKGEVFMIPPVMGLSTSLLNKDHHKVYYNNTPKFKVKLRRHGDEVVQLKNNYYKVLGRVDDAMNLGGIKVSATQIEEILQELIFVKECAAIAVSPKDGGPSKLIVFYVDSNLDDATSDKLQEAKQIIRKELNPLFKVSELLEIDVLPRTASNKVMRRKLRDIYNQ
ncbi:AMP-binding protein [uncultured Polaribacter sp.]|uniref:AMP-binding protein n=1 Tax=uncultured Polaribacter sp. TaxID=174711 RepID=UPI00262536A6|nr:AMP-binding protein [uncultured Polaribacter sp.]